MGLLCKERGSIMSMPVVNLVNETVVPVVADIDTEIIPEARF